ncbi:MAG: hypothetical protein V1773_16655 [bacterium]
MLKLSYIILLCLSISVMQAQSPHGKNFEVECSNCHQTDSWKVDLTKTSFDHKTTGFALMGQHSNTSCLNCHKTLEFNQVNNLCYQCHKDVHENTLGKECQRCHQPSSWIVEKITDIHQNSRFPLIGVHRTADCNQCHASVSGLRFDPIGIDCYDCHKKEYERTANPNHIAAGFSKDCNECHNINSSQWNTTSVVHDFFPLTGGHNLANCFACHKQNDFTGLSTECNSCHQNNFNNTTNPSHIALNFDAANCSECHTTNPGWQPVNFTIHNSYYQLLGAHVNVTCNNCHNNNYSATLPQTCFGCHVNDYNNVIEPPHAASNFSTDCTTCHNQNTWKPSSFNHDATYFPIYSGKHKSEWTKCSDCHTNTSNYQVFECINCHEHNKIDTDEKHGSVSGYNYQSNACYACHPTGSEENAFNHSTSNFPLTGAHLNTECIACHSSGYQGTSSVCVDCHLANYNSTSNPNHQSLNFGTECQSCHNTEVGWKVTQFTIHNNFYPLLGRHDVIKDQCAACHNGNYNNTPNTCYGCHSANYANTTNPAHQAVGFSTDCQVCHTQTNWAPSTFNHDVQYFPIYSNKHAGAWTTCSECHTTPNNLTQFSCIDCHEHNRTETNLKHTSISGYIYSSNECFACHPSGDVLGAFNHANSNFQLLGVHSTTECASCHISGYAGTNSSCVGCHQADYNGSVNPNHISLSISTDCGTCHTPQPDWTPASFPIHNNFYQLLGAHTTGSVSCDKCHNGNYNTTPNTCVGCHQTDYNNTTNPSHSASNFPTDCVTCHTQNAWTPATFDHDGPYFPIYSGKHNNQWTNCADCHVNTSNYKIFECINCHEHNKIDTDLEHTSVSGYIYSSNECLACHPNGSAEGAFNHATSNFQLLGVHSTTECASCHISGYAGTNSACVSCHQADYNNSANPNHSSLSISTDCGTCHTPQPDWRPASFPTHNNYYQLLGAHAAGSVSCIQCHNGNYNTTPNTCVGCHQTDYNNTTNPSHSTSNFPTDCVTCHTQSAWTPATFDHDGPYFPIYSGKHRNKWTKCSDCHVNVNNYAVFECINCHEHNQTSTNRDHNGIANYSYNSAACYSCHPRGSEDKSIIEHIKPLETR